MAHASILLLAESDKLNETQLVTSTATSPWTSSGEQQIALVMGHIRRA